MTYNEFISPSEKIAELLDFEKNESIIQNYTQQAVKKGLNLYTLIYWQSK